MTVDRGRTTAGGGDDDRTGSVERLDYADRWLRDGLAVLRPAFSVYQITVDMTAAMARLDTLRRAGTPAGVTPLLVLAASRALAAHAGLHQLVAGAKRHRPANVDIGLSTAGESFVAPVLVIEKADRKSLEEISSEIARRVPEVRRDDVAMLRTLRRWGRAVPVGFLRRALLRLLFLSAAFRRKGAGTFQISTVPVDWAVTSAFATTGVLVAGAVSSRVVAVGGQPVVRPTMTLTLCCDHGVWDGRAAARFLATVRQEIERPVTAARKNECRAPDSVAIGGAGVLAG